MEIDINKIIIDVRAASEALDTALHDALDAHALHAAREARAARAARDALDTALDALDGLHYLYGRREVDWRQ